MPPRFPKSSTSSKPGKGGGIEVHVDDSKWRALLARAHGLDERYVKVGVLESRGGGDARAPKAGDDPTEAATDTMTLAQLAALHEFGSEDGRTPERSFLRSTFLSRRAKELQSMCAKLCREVVTRDMPPERALGLLGAWAAAEVKSTIVDDDIPPPNAASTIAQKGSTKPLVDSGQLKNSISWELGSGEGES